MIILAVTIVIDVAEKIDKFIEMKPPLDLLITDYYFNFILYFGNLLSPICVFLAVIYFTSRMTNNVEIVPLLSGGVSFYRVLAPYIITSIVLAGLSFYLNAYAVPTAYDTQTSFEADYLKVQLVNRDVNIHKKIDYNEETGQETFIYLYSFNQLQNEGYMFSMEVIHDKDIIRKLNASKIIWNDTLGNWRLENVKVHHFEEKSERIVEIPTMDTTFLLTPEDIFIKKEKAETMTLDKLYPSVELERMRGSGLDLPLEIEIYKRYAYPFAMIILTIIGFAVSSQKRRGGTPLQIGIGLVIAFAYVIMVVTGQSLAGENIPTWLSVWTPNFIFFFIGVFLLRIARK